MTMRKFDQAFEEKLEETIAAIEKETSVEVVVAIAPSSDSYVDTFLKGGLVGLLIMLIFILYSPFFIPETMVPVDLTIAFLVGVAIVRLFPGVRRRLVSDRRKIHYVKSAANTFFMENHLVETVERTAFLVYISVFERKYQLIADKGVLAAIPNGVYETIDMGFRPLFSGGLLPGRILEVLLTLIEPFNRFMPPSAENVDEICNRLRRVTW